MHFALTLPEITLLIAQHLDQSDLTICIRVCRAWHQTFIPSLYRNVVLPPEPHRIHLQTLVPILHTFQHCIHSLSFQINIATPVWSFDNCVSLRRLHMSFGIATNMQSTSELPRFLANNGRYLTHLTLERFPRWTMHEVWTSLAASCTNLQTVELWNSALDTENQASLWRLCSNVQHLVLKNVFLFTNADSSAMATVAFSRLKSLDWVGVEGVSLSFLCTEVFPSATALEFFRYSCHRQGRIENSHQIDHLCQGLPRGSFWKNVHSLRLDGILDTEFAAILRHLSVPLQSLHASCSGFGGLAMGVMRERGHFATVQGLQLTQTFVESQMVQEILESCPVLEELAAPQLYGRDVVSGRPWVCRWLKALSVQIVLDEEASRQQAQVFERLAGLVLLKDMHLRSNFRSSAKPALDFRLERGLNLLRGLTKLTRLVLPAPQILGEEDVEWMVEHWINLREIVGTLNTTDACLEMLHACRVVNPHD
ncbi:hypothetical protein BGZ59_007617 [Podila verticillata]|uniref:F-box domain-containing protein n=1 Tax=Podila verticillata NRRL 6337 TaxID=1069443 RepID=A0A086TJN5_9FUNG|nr:hypothetical protein BGZ59_007617 [Podila verticillata]KFH62162.1 hypothetical protein MVEG_11801 [Podila verticillata NRRL 6337]